MESGELLALSALLDTTHSHCHHAVEIRFAYSIQEDKHASRPGFHGSQLRAGM